MNLEGIHTKEDLESLLDQLNTFSLEIYRGDGSDINKILEEKFDFRLAEFMRDEMKNAGIKIKSDGEGISSTQLDQLRDLVTELQNSIRTVPNLQLVLAFKPTEAFIKKLFNWVESNIGEGIVLDIILDKNIFGGAVVTFNGKYNDYSVLKKFQSSEILKNYKARFN